MLAQTCSYPSVYLADKTINFNKTKESIPFLSTLSAMYGIAAEAFEALKNLDLSDFDSLATDCACHLRSLKLASIAQKLSSNAEGLALQLDQAIESCKVQQAKFLQAAEDQTNPHKREKKSWKALEFLNEMQGTIDLPLDLVYAVHAYVLKVVKDYKPLTIAEGVCCSDPSCSHPLGGDQEMGIMKETTEVKKLVDKMKGLGHGNINVAMVKKELYDKAKEHLTALSAEFILQETASLSDKHVSVMLSLSKKMVASRVEIPDFYSLTGAFQVALEKQIPVVLKIKACLHAHRYQQPGTPFDVGLYLVPKKGKFKVKPLPSVSSDFPVIVVEAKRSGLFTQEESSQDYVQRLIPDFDFMKICAMDGAQHKQYTVDALGEVPSQTIEPLQLEEFAEEADRVDQFKAQAEVVGCSFSNQSLLILSHIFADKFSNQLALLPVFQQTAEWIGLEAASSLSGGA